MVSESFNPAEREAMTEGKAEGPEVELSESEIREEYPLDYVTEIAEEVHNITDREALQNQLELGTQKRARKVARRERDQARRDREGQRPAVTSYDRLKQASGFTVEELQAKGYLSVTPEIIPLCVRKNNPELANGCFKQAGSYFLIENREVTNIDGKFQELEAEIQKERVVSYAISEIMQDKAQLGELLKETKGKKNEAQLMPLLYDRVVKGIASR